MARSLLWRQRTSPTPTNSSGRNFSTTVTFWNQAICRMPARLIAAGSHRPSSAMPQLLMPDGWVRPNSESTYKTQDATMAAFPAQAEIQ